MEELYAFLRTLEKEVPGNPKIYLGVMDGNDKAITIKAIWSKSSCTLRIALLTISSMRALDYMLIKYFGDCHKRNIQHQDFD